MNECRLALRRLLQSPGYTLVALLTLALGIGVNTAMFGIVNTLLLRPGPYPEAGRLVRLFRTSPQSRSWPHSLPNLRDEQAQADVFSSLAAFQWWAFSLAEPGQPAERLSGVVAGADLFATLGTPPLLGRTFTPDEQQPGRDRVAVLSHDCWRQRFAGDPHIVGRTLRLDGESVTVIGVMPASFAYPLFWGRVEVWRPLALLPDWREDRGNNFLNAVARLKPGVSLAQAQTELDTIAARLARQYPANNAGIGLRIVPFHESAMDDVGHRISWMTLGLAGVVLLIACANLASLQLARAAAGARGLAVRAALGASRLRLMRQQLAESVLLALGGGALGLLLTVWLNAAIGRQVTLGDTPGLDIPLDLRVLGFALLASLATGAAFGSVPAWIASRVDLNVALKQQARGATADRSSHRLRHGLIVAEMMLVLVLLAGAGFFIGGIRRFVQRDFGWETTGLLTGSLTLPPNRYPDDAARHAFIDRLDQRLAALPGVDRVALGSSLPLWSFGSSTGVFVEGRPVPPPGREPLMYYAVVNADYFTALRIPLVAGRLFPARARRDGPREVVINETMARTLWPGESPLGKRISSSADKPEWEEVIGVVGDVSFAANLATPDTHLQAYRPLASRPWGYLAIGLRARAPETLAEPLRRAVAELDPDLPVAGLATVRARMDRSRHNFDLVNEMLAGFSVLGLFLAAIGLYGVIASLVTQRTSEFAIRVALGAPPRSVRWLVLGFGLRLVGAGSLLGLAGAVACVRLLGSLLPAVPGQDPLMLVLAAAALAAVGAAACWLPARRATRVDPMIALRSE